MGQLELRHSNHPQKRVSNRAPTLSPCYIWLLFTLINRTGLGRALFFTSVSYQALGWCFNLQGSDNAYKDKVPCLECRTRWLMCSAVPAAAVAELPFEIHSLKRVYFYFLVLFN